MMKIYLTLFLFLAVTVQAQDITQLESQYINKSQPGVAAESEDRILAKNKFGEIKRRKQYKKIS